MARKDDDLKLVYHIPKNYEEKSVTISGLSYRNIVEAVILVGIVVAILWVIPSNIMTFNVKLVVGIIIAAPLGILGLFGINQCSLSEFLMNVIKYKLNPPRYIRKSLFNRDDESD